MKTSLWAYTLAAFALVLTWSITYTAIEREKTRVTVAAVKDAERIAQIFETRTRTIVGYADNYVRSIRREYLRTRDIATVVRMIEDITYDQDIISHITIINSDGRPVFNSQFPIRPNVSAADREYFQHFEKTPIDGLYFSRASLGRNSGLTIARLVRPILSNSGEFQGVIFAGVRVATFVNFVSAMGVGSDSTATLIGTDRFIRAREPSFPEGDEQDSSHSIIWEKIQANSVGNYRERSHLDDIDRRYAYRVLDTLPFVATIGLSENAIEARYETFQWSGYGIAVLISFSVILIVVLYKREMQSVVAMSESYDRFQSFANAAADWFWEMDADLRFTYVSENVEEMVGVPADWHIGKTREEIINDKVPRKQWSEHAATLEARKPFRDFTYERKTPDGQKQWIRVSGLPIFDHRGQFLGYRGTASDVSDEIAAEARLKRAYEELEETIEKRTRELQDEVAERKKAEEGLRKSQEQLRDFGAAASDWYWEMDENLRFSYFSERFLEVTGVEPDKLLGKTRQETGIPGVDPTQWLKHLDDLDQRRPFRNFVHPRIQNDGSEVWLSINGKPTFNEDGTFAGYRGTGSDITEWRKAQSRILSLTSAIESMPEPVAVFDEDDLFSFTNHAYRELNSQVADSIQVGKPFKGYIEQLVHEKLVPSAVGREKEWIEIRLENHSKSSAYFEDYRQDGKWYLCVDNALPRGGRVLLLTDITTMKSAQFELEEAKAEAEAASQAKSDFLSSMSHELRTPMNAILGFAQMLGMYPNSKLSETEMEYIGHITESGEHLLALITQVLELSKIEAGYMEVSIEAVNPNDVIDQSIASSRAMATRENITFVDKTTETPLPDVNVDAMRFRQILLNLMSNAVRYNRDGGSVTVSGYKIPGGFVRIVVQDTGIGIPEEFHARLFEPFDRHAAHIADVHGTGIGLTITKRLITLLGGRIGFESEEDVGSTFWVDLPLSEEHSKDPTTGQTPRKPTERYPMVDDKLNGIRVLYVEDNVINVQLMETIFDDIPGSTLLVARDGENGLHQAKASAPDIILMDIGLPGMDGIETTKALKGDPATANIPVIAISAAAMKSDIERASSAGFFAYLTKPIDIVETLSKIKEALDQAQKNAEQ